VKSGNSAKQFIIYYTSLVCGANCLYKPKIRCATDHSPAIMEHLLTGTAQLGFVLKCPPIAGIQIECIWRSRIVPVVHHSHHLAQAGKLRIADIANELVAPQYWGDVCEDLIKQIRLTRTVHGPIHAIQPASAASEMALEHGYLTFMPEMAVRRDLREGRLVKLELLDLPLWQWEVMMAWRSGKRVDASQQQVLDTIDTIRTISANRA
jgi:DNA-binding transcriptional LysR family regulator